MVGPNADDVDAQLGDWAGRSGQVDWMREEGHPREMTETVLDGLRALAPAGWTVAYAKGAEIGELGPDPEGEFHPDGQPRMPILHAAEPDAAMIAEAVAAARGSDHVVAVVGDTIGLMGETRSTATLELVGGQVALLDALAATGTPMTVVLIASKPLVLPQSALDADAIVWAANPGMRGGRAIAELLLGLVEPAGRLPLTFARHVGQQPVYYNQVRGQHGARYADLTQDPAFAFGEGLTYSTVEYSGLTLDRTQLTADGTVRGRVTLTNTGVRPSHEVVQVYISDLVTSATWTDKELKSFVHVDVPAGGSVVVDVAVPVSACTIVDAHERRVVEPGDFELLVGRSSRDADLLRTPFTVLP